MRTRPPVSVTAACAALSLLGTAVPRPALAADQPVFLVLASCQVEGGGTASVPILAEAGEAQHTAISLLMQFFQCVPGTMRLEIVLRL